MLKQIAIGALAMGVVSLSHGQSISAFTTVTSISGVSSSLTGNNLNLTVGAAPKFTWDAVTYTIEKVWGVWALDDTDDLSATGPDFGNWNFNSNFAGFGGIAGWKAQNPNQGLSANSSMNFTYSTLTGTREGFGYHVRVVGTLPGGGNTMHIRGAAPVPEPASMSAILLGLGFIAKRKRK